MQYFPLPTMKYKKPVQQLIKESNAKRLFWAVSCAGSTSRAAMAKQFELSPTTVSVLIDEMVGRGLLLQTGETAVTKTGRRPLMLEVNPDGRYIPVVTLLPDGLQYALCDLTFRVIESVFLPASYQSDPAVLLLALLDKAAPFDYSRVPALCIVLSDLFTLTEDRILAAEPAIQWDFTFIDQLQARLRLPILLGDAPGCCANALKGTAQGDTLLYLSLTGGVGAGILHDGAVFTCGGKTPDLAHFSISDQGEPCICGGRGCLVQAVGRPALLRKTRSEAENTPGCALLARAEGDAQRIDWPTLCAAFVAYDPIARAVFSEAARQLARGIGNLLCLFPAASVVFGGLDELGEGFLNLLRRQMSEQYGKKFQSRVSLRYSELGPHGSAVGAAKLLCESWMPVSE